MPINWLEGNLFKPRIPYKVSGGMIMGSKKSGPLKIPNHKGQNGQQKRMSTRELKMIEIDFAQCCDGTDLSLTGVGTMEWPERKGVYDAMGGRDGCDSYLCVMQEGKPVGVVSNDRKFRFFEADDALAYVQRGLRSRGYGDL
jgi:hypothetical protein